MPDRSFGEQYTVVRELGGGGMSRVFLAREVRLGRDVVIKILSPDLAATISTERFAREMRLAGALQHPHIVPILAAGESEGMPYFVMPFIPGRTLRERIAAGRVPADEATKILSDVATALEHAHTHGIVHRDIKPENILLQGRTAVVADFGIAKAVTVARTEDAGAGLTTTGTTLGTPAYMAPEQVTADEVDERCDLYSWGVVAYELLAGHHPFSAKKSPRQMMSAHVIDRPVDLHKSLGDTGPGAAQLADVVMRCLEKEPDRRPESAAAVLTALRGVSGPHPAGQRTHTAASVAVLPFANLSNDPENDYFSDGITEEIIGMLARSSLLRVAGRASSFSFKGKDVDFREVGERLSVETIVEGSVRRIGNRVRVTAEIVSARDGFQLWSERFDREVTDVFALQDEIAQAVLSALAPAAPAMPAGTPELSAPLRTPVDPRAYDLYLKGRFILRSQLVAGNAIERAMANFQEAVKLEPGFAAAHAGIADANVSAAIYLVKPIAEAMTLARKEADIAASLEPQLAEAHVLAGYVSFLYDWDWEDADRHFQRGLQIKPDDPTTHVRIALFESSRGAVDAAMHHASRGVEIDPLSAWVRYVAGAAMVAAHRPDEARSYLMGALELDPHFAEAHRWLSILAVIMRDPDEALARAETAAALTNRNPWAVVSLLMSHAIAGRRADAQACLGELLERRKRDRVIPLALAFAHMSLGNADEAFEFLDQSVAQRDFWLPFAAHAPQYDLFRGDARFADVLRRIGAPPRAR